MIPDIHLVNVQPYKDTLVEFHPGVNFITGPSDVGKSTVIRGMVNIVTGKPSGDSLMRHDSKEMAITMKEVTRRRSSAKNQYELRGEIFKALRTDVPQEITDALRLTDINFQSQHAPYFLISDAPGQVARTLNQVADLQIVDDSLKAVRQKVKEAKTQKKYLESQLAIKQKEEKELEWVAAADVDYKLIEDLEASAKAIDVIRISEQIDTVTRLHALVNGIPVVGGDLKLLAAVEKKMDVDLILSGLIRQVEENQVVIPDPRSDIKAIDPMVARLGDDYSGLKTMIVNAVAYQAGFDAYPSSIDDLGPVVDGVNQATAAAEALEELILELIVAEDCRDEAVNVLSEKNLEYEEWQAEVGVCPLCGNQLKGVTNERFDD